MYWKLCQLKPQWASTTHLLKYLKWKSLTIPRTGEEAEQLKLSFAIDENANFRILFGSFWKRHKPHYNMTEPLHSSFSKNIKVYVYTKTWIQMFIAEKKKNSEYSVRLNIYSVQGPRMAMSSKNINSTLGLYNSWYWNLKRCLIWQWIFSGPALHIELAL